MRSAHAQIAYVLSGHGTHSSPRRGITFWSKMTSILLNGLPYISASESVDLKDTDTPSGEATLSKLVCLPSEKRSILKGKLCLFNTL